MTETVTTNAVQLPDQAMATTYPSDGFGATRLRWSTAPELTFVMSALLGTLTASVSLPAVPEDATFTVSGSRRLAVPLPRVISRSVGEADVLLESPNWMQGRISELRARGYQRLNDPRGR